MTTATPPRQRSVPLTGLYHLFLTAREYEAAFGVKVEATIGTDWAVGLRFTPGGGGGGEAFSDPAAATGWLQGRISGDERGV